MDPSIEAEQADGHSVKRCRELFEVSRAAYYERRYGEPCARDVSDAELTKQIRVVHDESKGTYGSPRVHRELNHRGVACGRRRVVRLMRRAGLEGRAKKRWRTTTVPDPDFERARDLIGRQFGPGTELDHRYVGDITYITTWEEWAYLATVIDPGSAPGRRQALADHMRTDCSPTPSRWPSSPADHRPAEDEGTEMRQLRAEMRRRMLGNGSGARPVEMDCHLKSICESCTFVITIEFKPILRKQRDDAAHKGQLGRQKVFDGLINRLDEEAP